CSRASSIRSSRPSRPARAAVWACRSPTASSASTAGGCTRRTVRRAARCSSSSCRRGSGPERAARGPARAAADDAADRDRVRASPVGFAGPRRLNAPGLAFEALPPIDVVVISHDHYDHLDRRSVERLAAAHKPLFLVPLGLKAWFASLGIERVQELDWWDRHRVGAVTFTLTP